MDDALGKSAGHACCKLVELAADLAGEARE